MSCPICGDRGIVRIRYRDKSPDAYGLCLCEVGERWRHAENAGRPTNPAWHLWAARRGIPHDQVFPVEELLEEHELETIPRSAASPAASIADVMRTRRPKL